MLKIQNKRLTGLQLQVAGEIIIAICQNILHLDSIANDLSIALHIKGSRFAGAVEDGKGSLTIVLTGDDIDAIIGNELDLLTLRNHRIPLSPM